MGEITTKNAGFSSSNFRIPSGPPASNRHGGQNSGISEGLGGVCQGGPAILQNPEKDCLFLGNFSRIY